MTGLDRVIFSPQDEKESRIGWRQCGQDQSGMESAGREQRPRLRGVSSNCPHRPEFSVRVGLLMRREEKKVTHTICIFSVKVDGEEIVLSVFDTAGQEEYDM